MAIEKLPTNFQDDILDSSMGGHRRYQLVANTDGTFSLVDATTYTQTGSDFGADQINAANEAVNLTIDDLGDISELDTVAKANLVAAVNEILGKANTVTGNIGTMSSLSTSTKANLVAAINEIVSKAWYKNSSVLSVGANSRVSINEDAEGGNITVRPPASYGNVYWQIDAYNKNLRFYYYNGSAIPTMVTIPMDAGTFNVRPPVKWTNYVASYWVWTNNTWAPISGVWTAPRAGTAIVTGCFMFNSFANTPIRRICGLFLNGAEYALGETDATSTATLWCQSSAIMQVSAGNTVQMKGYHTASGESHEATNCRLNILFFPS